MMDSNLQKPGDFILDRFMPHASTPNREAARENLRRLARLLIQMSDRIAQEQLTQTIREKTDCELD